MLFFYYRLCPNFINTIYSGSKLYFKMEFQIYVKNVTKYLRIQVYTHILQRFYMIYMGKNVLENNGLLK
jgi:hypothetical protein